MVIKKQGQILIILISQHLGQLTNFSKVCPFVLHYQPKRKSRNVWGFLLVSAGVADFTWLPVNGAHRKQDGWTHPSRPRKHRAVLAPGHSLVTLPCPGAQQSLPPWLSCALKQPSVACAPAERGERRLHRVCVKGWGLRRMHRHSVFLSGKTLYALNSLW